MRSREEIDALLSNASGRRHTWQDMVAICTLDVLLDIREHLINTEAIREYEEALKKPLPLEIKIQGTSDKTDG